MSTDWKGFNSDGLALANQGRWTDAIHAFERALAEVEGADQERAILLALTRPFVRITGRPGSGKTRILQIVVAELTKRSGAPPLLLGPTGKSVVVMREGRARSEAASRTASRSSAG